LRESSPVQLSAIDDRDSLTRFFASRLGAMPGEDEGVLHVAAVWRPPGEDRHVVLRIRDETPKSAIDFLLLNLARARAEAIVTTGRILREEPGVTHDLQGEPGAVRALRAWRRETLGLVDPPWLVVLTGGRDLDVRHPALSSWSRPIVCCPAAAAEDVRRRVRGSAIEVVPDDAPGLRAAIAHLGQRRGVRRISIEAGPSTAAAAYDAPVVIDELVLSIYGGAALAPALAGGELPGRAAIERAVGARRASFSAEESSGRWTFEHYRCAIVRRR
jgi:riboflavin biosynthesis pyrimidine reductase